MMLLMWLKICLKVNNMTTIRNETPRQKRIRDKYSKLDDEGKIADSVKVEQKIKRIRIMVRTLLREIEEIEKAL